MHTHLLVDHRRVILFTFFFCVTHLHVPHNTLQNHLVQCKLLIPRPQARPLGLRMRLPRHTYSLAPIVDQTCTSGGVDVHTHSFFDHPSVIFSHVFVQITYCTIHFRSILNLSFPDHKQTMRTGNETAKTYT